MVFSFDEVGTLMDEIVDSFPEEFYRELNGSVLLLEDTKMDPEAPDLYVMGAYCHDPLVRYIEIYYGSFAELAKQEDWTEDDWHEELWTTLSHELTHHIESLAGEWTLEDKDDEFMEHYWAQRNRKKNPTNEAQSSKES